MELQVTRSVLRALLDEAGKAGADECCGILLGSGNRIDAVAPAANIAPDPCRRFEIDPQALVDAHRAHRSGGPEVIGYFHSHPHGSAMPSATDRAEAAHDGKVWAIVAGDEVAFWRDLEPGFVAIGHSVCE